jgi:predicted RNA-binding protein with PIN domain
MVYLIDGNNLLYAAHTHLPGPAIGRQRLCEILADWARQTAADLTVVFDGPPPRPGVIQQMQAPNLTVVFSGPRSADEVIEELIERAPAPAAMYVITGDRAIQSAARRRRCRCLTSADFARGLASPPPSTLSENLPPAPPPEKPGALLPEETDEWLRRFDFDPDQPPDDLDLIR